MAEDATFGAVAAPLLAASSPTEDDFQEILQRLRGGALLKDLLGGEGQVTRWQWRRKLKEDSAFAALVECTLREHRSKSRVTSGTWQGVLQAAAELKNLKAVARRPHMPTYEAILAKMKRDRNFDAQIRRHVTVGPLIRHSRKMVLKAVARIEEGASYKQVHAEGLPGRRSLLKHIQSDDELQRRLEGKLPRVGSKVSPETILQTLQAVGGQTSLRKIEASGGISRAAIYYWRSRDQRIADAAEHAIARVRRGRGPVYQEADYSRALAHLQAGHPLSSLRQFGLPSAEALRSRGRIDPGFHERYRAAVEIYRALGTDGEGVTLQRALSQNELYAAVDQALGRGLDPFVREEVRSEMILAVLDGEITEAEITRETAREFVADYYRSARGWRHQSLDAAVWDRSTRTRHDLIAA